MATMTVPLGNRVDAELKCDFEKTAEEIGLTSTAAITVFMKRFVAEGGFPFAVRRPVPTEEQFAAEMEARYQRMLAGAEFQHDLIEV
ncbi:MAG: type II toxin-antitoxin system RelB/DinJ family antitoxin [Coriobacteriaceae bacterium]|nr:type II toxin-antitoxin system RelB/DinJ family antitoxin [Coriobacteriaceae bacterium]